MKTLKIIFTQLTVLTATVTLNSIKVSGIIAGE